MEGVLKQQIHGSKLPKTHQIDQIARIPKWLFLVEIFEFLKNEEKFGGFVGETQSNPWQPRALIPYDAVRPDLHRFEAGKAENTKNKEEHTKGKISKHTR